MGFAYPKHCCCLRDCWTHERLGYGACQDSRDPDLCEDCESAKKRYLAAQRKKKKIVLDKLVEI